MTTTIARVSLIVSTVILVLMVLGSGGGIGAAELWIANVCVIVWGASAVVLFMRTRRKEQ
jgi:hypothetical protein